MAASVVTPMTDADPLCRLTSAELSKGYSSGALSPVDVATAALDRAEAINPTFNAFTRIDRDSALAAARASEQRWHTQAPLSPVDGVPTTIKDIVWVKDWPIRYGSLSTNDTPCTADSPAVARLRAAGTVILGLTTTPEFGWKALTDGPLSGITRNPWNPAVTPGGSSGGAAVAAATGAGVFHLGTDGGGSIRIPSAFTGITGHKPTYGRVPAYPASGFGTVAHLGPMTRGVADARAMLKVMSGNDDQDWLQGPADLQPLDDATRRFKGARIGFWATPPCGTVDPEIAATVQGVVQQLEALGAIVEPITLPGTDVLETFNVLWYSGAAARIAPLSAEARVDVDPDLLDMVAAGEKYGAVRYVQAMAARAEFGLAMDNLLARFDIVISPATSVPPFAVSHEVPPHSGLPRWIEWAGFSFPINLSQQPACVVPCGQTESGLPIGLQFVGARGADSAVLSYAAAFQEAFPAQFL
jgi:aspartyl-tRNA(Asn)/glutamyl-tRNA(Gln) amidotransferase subunit A